MMRISRRNMLIGSGAAVALGACGGPKSKDCPSAPSPSFTTKNFQGTWNKGDEPWESVDSRPGYGDYGKLVDFTTKKVCLIYIEVIAKPFSLNVARVYFEASAPGTSWADVAAEITSLIDRLNPAPFPLPPAGSRPPWDLFSGDPKYKLWLGFKDFAFNQQHHVIFYVRNQGSDFNGQFPIWFGDRLQGTVLDHTGSQQQADLNYSFYGARKETIALATEASEWSSAVIYVRNHYQKLKGGKYEPISNQAGSQDRLVYALNINVITRTRDGQLEIPMIIDPDTGNMGEGQP